MRIRPKISPGHSSDLAAVLWQAIRDSIFYTETSAGRQDLASITDDRERFAAFKFWRLAAERNQRNHPIEVAAFRMELEHRKWDDLMAVDWLKFGSVPATPGPVREAGDGE